MTVTELWSSVPEPAPAPLPVVGIVGAGTMGRGIAQLAASHGHEVLLHDVDRIALDQAVERIRRGVARRDARGSLPDRGSPSADSVADRLHPVASLAGLAGRADVIVEAVLEDLALKRRVFHALDAAAGPDVILATNTSALSIDAIAAAASRPGRVVGLHFFNPAPIMPLVEVVAGRASQEEALDRAENLAKAWGKTPVRCRDVAGFAVNRVNRPFTLEALRVVSEGGASVEEIDDAIRQDGFPMGPFQLMDLVGIDVNLAVARAIHEGLGRPPRLAPSPIQERLVEVGRFGRKTGQGFYRYDPDGRRLGPASEFDQPAVGVFEAPELIARIVMGVANEAYHALDDNVAEPAAIDLAVRLGAAHPIGPFERIQRLGGPGVAVEMLTVLADRYGDRFRPAPALRRAVDD